MKSGQDLSVGKGCIRIPAVGQDTRIDVAFDPEDPDARADIALRVEDDGAPRVAGGQGVGDVFRHYARGSAGSGQPAQSCV